LSVVDKKLDSSLDIRAIMPVRFTQLETVI
jgi:hypothetical protein